MLGSENKEEPEEKNKTNDDDNSTKGPDQVFVLNSYEKKFVIWAGQSVALFCGEFYQLKLTRGST